MEKRAQNTFVAGLNTDRHPLTAQNTELIDAKNIDLVAVGEGYQLILQKREGNLEVLKLHDYSVVWNSETTYSPGIYALYDNNVYLSLLESVNIQPDSDDTYWELQELESAGLPEGYVPLAVKEFNNIAYIISVNAGGRGEIGTFPSPDYDNFKYETGAEYEGVASIGDRVWDPRLNPPSYEFTLLNFAPGSGTDEEITSQTPMFQLTKAGFTLKNTGLDTDEFIVSTTEAGGTMMFVNGVFFDSQNDTITLAPNAEAVFTFKHVDPWTPVGELIYFPPAVVDSVTVTVTSINNPVLDEKTYNYVYHIARGINLTEVTTPGDVPKAGGTKTYSWVTNATDITSISATNFLLRPPYPNGGLEAGDNTFVYANQIDVILGANPYPQFRRTVDAFGIMTAPYAMFVPIYIEQLYT